FCRNFSGDRAVVTHAHHPIVSHVANFRAGHIPFLENFAHNILFSALGDDQHAFLGFTQQNLIRRHARLAFRNFREIDFDAAPAAAGGFASRTRETGCAHGLNFCHSVAGGKLETCFQYSFSLNGSPTCTAGRSWRDSSVSSREANAAPASPSRPVSAP